MPSKKHTNNLNLPFLTFLSELNKDYILVILKELQEKNNDKITSIEKISETILERKGFQDINPQARNLLTQKIGFLMPELISRKKVKRPRPHFFSEGVQVSASNTDASSTTKRKDYIDVDDETTGNENAAKKQKNDLQENDLKKLKELKESFTCKYEQAENLLNKINSQMPPILNRIAPEFLKFQLLSHKLSTVHDITVFSNQIAELEQLLLCLKACNKILSTRSFSALNAQTAIDLTQVSTNLTQDNDADDSSKTNCTASR